LPSPMAPKSRGLNVSDSLERKVRATEPVNCGVNVAAASSASADLARNTTVAPIG
jgi:hypothetical protein